MEIFEQMLETARQSYQELLNFRHDVNFHLMVSESQYEQDKADCLAFIDAVTKVINGTQTKEEFYKLYPDAIRDLENKAFIARVNKNLSEEMGFDCKIGDGFQ